MRARVAAVVLLGAGCQWIDEDGGRYDQDNDDIHVREDCNDRRGEVSFLEPFSGMASCGDVIEADAADGIDVLGIVNCLHPFSDEDLTHLGWRESVYGFVSEAGTDVLVELDTEELLVEPSDVDSAGTALIAIRGSRCRLDACEHSQPLMPTEWRENNGNPTPIDEREPYAPSLSFHAEPGELWHIIVSGGAPGNPAPASPFRLRVGCVSDA